MLNAVGPIDMHDPATLQHYFEKWYPLEDTDRNEIQAWRERLNYPEVAKRFQMIEDDTVNVVVTSYGDDVVQQRVLSILERLRSGAPPTRDLMRQLQPYLVSLWAHRAKEYLNQGFLSPKDSEGIAPGIWEWIGEYDAVRGLTAADMTADRLVC
jgi:CRISPR-associated endonuclease/helicase Cas3